MKQNLLKILNTVMVLAIMVKNLYDAYWLLNDPVHSMDRIVSDDYCVILGWLSLACAVLILLPETFVTGYLLTIYKMLNVIAFYIVEEKRAAAFWEIPLLVVAILLIRYGHSFSKRYLWSDIMLEDDNE
jgi:hypothetical protein